MERIGKSAFLLRDFWTGWRLWTAWFLCISAILLLGTIRIATDAEFSFAALLLLPVLVIAWIGGTWAGLFIGVLATVMWAVGDIVTERHFSASWIPWANAVTRLITYSLMAILAAQLRLQFEKENEYATHDILTGLHNRRAFFDAGAFEIERSKRYARPLTVIFLDLDNFKQLNDSQGHDAGDAALEATAKALLGALRSSDRVARLGGDEFAVLLPEIGYEEAVEASRKIFNAANDALINFPPVRGSIGVAWFGEIDRTFPAMLKAADKLMYEIKHSGKDGMRSLRFTHN